MFPMSFVTDATPNEPKSKKHKGQASSSSSSSSSSLLTHTRVVDAGDGYVCVRCESIKAGDVNFYVFALTKDNLTTGLDYVVRGVWVLGLDYLVRGVWGLGGNISIIMKTKEDAPQEMIRAAAMFEFPLDEMVCFHVPYKNAVECDNTTNIFIRHDNLSMEQEYKLIPRRPLEIPWVPNSTHCQTKDTQTISTVPQTKIQRKQTTTRTGIDLPLAQPENKILSVAIGTENAVVVPSNTTATAGKQKRKQRTSVKKNTVKKNSTAETTNDDCNLPLLGACNERTAVPLKITQSESKLGAVRVSTVNHANAATIATVLEKKKTIKMTECKEVTSGIKLNGENQHRDPDETDLFFAYDERDMLMR
jgi:hypothetical protein